LPPSRLEDRCLRVRLTLLTLGCGSGSGTKSGSSGAASVGAPAGKVAGIAYTVTSARGVTKIGNASDGITKSKQGKFVLVELALTNTTKRTYTFAAPETAWITTKNGKRYDPVTEIGTSLGDDDLFSAQLAPGEKRKGKLAFDLPAAELSGAILHIEEELIDDKNTLKVDLGL
jgi:hypothetical protein